MKTNLLSKKRTFSYRRCLLLFAAVWLALAGTSIQAQTGTTKICSASDLHYFNPSLLVNDGIAFQTYLAQDRKLIAESKAITEALVRKINEEKPEIFLVTGDLTKDGEKLSHQDMARYLDSIEMNGVTKVYVIPGNHDVNNVDAYSYDGSTQTKVDYISPADFKTIYRNFGYGEATDTDPASLSYLAKPKSKLWILGIDVCMYDSNIALNEPVTAGRFKPETYQWVLARLAEAKAAGATVIGMMHHGLTEHYTGQSVSFPEYVVAGWDTISVRLADAGLKLMFTGHFHANDITKRGGTGTNFVYDIETGSTVTWPCPYRVMNLNPDNYFDITTKTINEINYNTNGKTFQEYAYDYLIKGMTGIVKYTLMQAPYSLDDTTATIMTPHVVNAYAAHYAGDEKMPASEKAFISYLSSNNQASFAGMLTSLWTDLNPADNNIILNLNSGLDLITYANTLVDTSYTVPSWTLLKRALTKASNTGDSASMANLWNAIKNLANRQKPYNVNMTINGDPATRMGFTWFTNKGITSGSVQIVKGVKDSTGFGNAATFVANTTDVNNLNYNVAANQLLALAGIANNTTKSYVSHKAVVTGLKPNTKYSYRVGSVGAYSAIGTFTTAKDTKEPFTFMYFTDTQAQCDSMFDISQRTVHAAKNTIPNAKFALIAGDLVESSGTPNSEWEYEQWFETMQDVWHTTPLAPIEGNHDKSTNKNCTYHFNTLNPQFDKNMSTVPGSYYSFVYGNALFMALSYEDYSKAGMLDSAANWMSAQVKANPTVKWRIAFYHKTMFTGSSSHQSDADGRAVREKMGPVFDSLKINLAIQGHDHIYEVIGPVNSATRMLIPNRITNQQTVAVDADKNLTGKLGGTYDLSSGTLYFLNSSAGIKKYAPRNKAQMDAAEAAINMSNYWSLFTGRFGQTGPQIGGNDLLAGDPMFSSIRVSTDSINIVTYSVGKHSGVISKFDAFKIVDTISVTSVELSEKTKTLAIETTASIVATVYPLNADNKKVIWSSSNHNIATVSREGVISAVNVGTAKITVTTIDGGKIATCIITVVPDGKVLCEKWTNIRGESVSRIPLRTAPDSTFELTSLEIPANTGDNYGVRIRGYIIPSTTGKYNLYIASDDNGELWLSETDQPGQKDRIAYVPGWTNTYEWNKYRSQKSGSISFKAGKKYYFEALMKESRGSDNLAIGWTGTDIKQVTVIGSANISSYHAHKSETKEGPVNCISNLKSETSEDKVSNDQNLNSSTVTIYPNPITGNILHLSISGYAENETIELKIFNVLGKMVYRQMLTLAGVEQTIDCSSLPKGVYLLKLYGSNEYNTYKIVKE